MSRSIIIASQGSGVQSASTTSYNALSTSNFRGIDSPTTEAFYQIPYQSSGRITNLSLRVGANDRGTSTLKLRKNGANGNNALSISGTGEFQDTSSTDSVAVGDLMGLQLVTGAGGTTFILQAQSAIYNPDIFSQTPTRLGVFIGAGQTLSVASTTTFFGISGNGANTTEATVNNLVRTAGTIKNMAMYVSANTSANTVTAGSRKNTAAGNLTISITAAATGLFQDNTNQDLVVPGDTIDYFVTTGAGSTSITFNYISISYITTNAYIDILNSGNRVINAAVTTNFGFGSSFVNATESFMQIKALAPLFASHLYVNLATNTITATSTFKFRKNAANGNNSLSVPSSTTGAFEDLTSIDAVVITDEMNIQAVMGATGTSMAVNKTSMLFQNVPDSSPFFGAGP